MEALHQLIQAFAKRRRLYQGLYIAYALLIVLAFALSFVDQRIAVALAITDIAFFLLGFSPMLKQYRRAFSSASVQYGIGRALDQAQYSGKEEIAEQEILNCPALLTDDTTGRILLREGVTGRKGDVTLQANEISLHYNANAVSGGKNQYRFLSGTLLKLQWPAGGALRFALLFAQRDTPAVQQKLGAAGYIFTPLPSSDLAQAFRLYTAAQAPLNGEQVRALQKRLRAVLEEAPQDLILFSDGSSLLVFYSNYFYTTNLKVRTPITEELVTAQRVPALTALLTMADWSRTHESS